jgi:hypothetical protein
VLVATLFFSCDAPRENPLDPENPDNIFSSLSGIVRTVKVPNEPLSGVNVLWSKANIVVQTNSTGNFSIEDLKPENGYLYFEKEGYSKDSLFVDWNGRKSVNIIQQLNSIPKLVSGKLASTVINRFPDAQVYRINAEANITDEENDVDSVFITNNDLQFSGNLNNLSVTQFQQEFTPEQMNLTSVDDIIGKEFNVIAKDANGKTFNIAQLTVKRIIKELIETISPANNETVSDSLTLNWRRFTPGYSFTYSLSIFTNTVDPELIWSVNDVSSEEIFYEVESNINPGEYFWVVWVIDEFGNSARSRPASFIIQ